MSVWGQKDRRKLYQAGHVTSDLYLMCSISAIRDYGVSGKTIQQGVIKNLVITNRPHVSSSSQLMQNATRRCIGKSAVDEMSLKTNQGHRKHRE